MKWRQIILVPFQYITFISCLASLVLLIICDALEEDDEPL
jgi:hypothetical protein